LYIASLEGDDGVMATPQNDGVMATPQALSYEEAKTQQFERAVGVTIYGVPLEVGDQKALISGRRFQPIIGCLCVWDSPDSPCPCKDAIIWLPVEQILITNETDRKTVQGYRLHMFTVSSDAEVLVEDRVRSYSARVLHQALAVDAELLEVSSDETAAPDIMLKPKRPPL
jgi:hypothetical protein